MTDTITNTIINILLYIIALYNKITLYNLPNFVFDGGFGGSFDGGIGGIVDGGLGSIVDGGIGSIVIGGIVDGGFGGITGD